MRRAISPLGLRIWVIVIFPLAMFYIGLVQVDKYRSTATAAQLDALYRQGHALASSIGLADVEISPLARQRFSELTAHRAMQLISGIPDARVMIFQPDGTLIGDSASPGNDLAPPHTALNPIPPEGDMPARLTALAAWLAGLLSPAEEYPLMPEPGAEGEGVITAADFPAIATALATGEAGSLLMRDGEGRLILGVAVPVRHLRVVRGALLVTAPGEALERDIREVEYAFFLVFLGTLLITIALGYYLARSITGPLARLARAADAVRLAHDRPPAWPDMTGRGDEIGDLALTLAAMTRELQGRAAATASFAADVAHEIKNPISSLRSAVETLGRIGDEAQRRKLMDIMLADLRRLDRLITDIAAASRLDADMGAAEFTILDLAEILRGFAEARQLADGGGAARGIRLITHAPAHPVAVRGIAHRLVQVLDNLYANAVSFSPDGGAITLTLAVAHKRAVLTMADEGSGIPEGKREDIFARFYTERPAGEGFGQHSGLGLSISRKIAEIHGGKLTAHNGESGGAVFRLELPLASGA